MNSRLVWIMLKTTYLFWITLKTNIAIWHTRPGYNNLVDFIEVAQSWSSVLCTPFSSTDFITAASYHIRQLQQVLKEAHLGKYPAAPCSLYEFVYEWWRAERAVNGITNSVLFTLHTMTTATQATPTVSIHLKINTGILVCRFRSFPDQNASLCIWKLDYFLHK